MSLVVRPVLSGTGCSLLVLVHLVVACCLVQLVPEVSGICLGGNLVIPVVVLIGYPAVSVLVPPAAVAVVVETVTGSRTVVVAGSAGILLHSHDCTCPFHDRCVW